MYSGKITRFVLVSCIMAAMGGLLFGYDIGSAGGVSSMDSFLKKFFRNVYTKMKQDKNISNYCKFNSQLLTSFTSSLYVAGLFTTFLASWVTTSLGCRPSILAGGIVFLAGSALGGAALNVYMAIFSRVLLGVGVGFANQDSGSLAGLGFVSTLVQFKDLGDEISTTKWDEFEIHAHLMGFQHLCVARTSNNQCNALARSNRASATMQLRNSEEYRIITFISHVIEREEGVELVG